MSLEPMGLGLFKMDGKPDGRDTSPQLNMNGGAKPKGKSKGKKQARTHVAMGPPPPSPWTAPTEFPRLSGIISIDVETRDEGLRQGIGAGWAMRDMGEVIGVGVSWMDGRGYWPIRHPDSNNFEADGVFRWLEDSIANASRVYMHHATYDWGWLRRSGVKIKSDAPIVDTQTMAALINENRKRYNLSALGEEYFRIKKDDALLKLAAAHYGIDPKNEMYKLPARYVGIYSEQDAHLCHALGIRQEQETDDQNLREAYDLEMGLIPLHLEMRWRGVRIDMAAAEEARDKIEAWEKRAARELKQLCGFEVGIWTPEAITEAFRRNDLPIPLNEAGNPSFESDVMAQMEHPIPRLLAEMRRWNKARGTFLEGHVLGHAKDGRIHCQFNPTISEEGGTVSYRYSSSDPNLQQIPSKDNDEVIAKLLRGLFIPEDGELWYSDDFSQQEPRITVHLAALAKCDGAWDAVLAYRNDPDLDYHQYVSTTMGIPRPPAKRINLAMVYGKGEVALCHDLKLPTIKKMVKVRGSNPPEMKMGEFAGPEGKALFAEYHKTFPYAKQLAEKCKKVIAVKGYLTTLTGHRCRFLPDGKGGYMYLHKVVNRIVQSGAAGQLKRAMLDLWHMGKVPLITLHDELAGSCVDLPEAELIAEVMKAAIPLLVPNKVDVETGPSWGKAA